MTISAAKSRAYAGDVAKIEISIPDDLLGRIDEFLKRSGGTRSDFLRRISERELVAEDARRQQEFKDLLGPPPPKGIGLGIDPAQMIREDRDNNHGH